MTTTSAYSSASMPLYDIHRNDFVNQNYQVPINDGLDMGSEQSLYPPSVNEVLAPNFLYHLPSQQSNNLSYFQRPQMRLAQTFQTNGVMYNGGMVPTFQPYTGLAHFQTLAPSFISAPSLASSSSSSLQYALTPSPAPLSKEVHKATPKSKSKGKRATRNATQVAKRELLIGKQPRRKRGPNKRPAGTAFSNLLDGLPDNVKEALDQNYQGCCESVNTKDLSTKQKHMFSNRHCKNILQEYQEQIPNFVCPAFVAFKSNCRAKAGRYDSTDRHCKNCVGFHQINRSNKAVPIVITRAQYTAIQTYRTRLAAREVEKQATDQSTEQADNVARQEILSDLFKDGIPDWFPDFNQQGESDSVVTTDVTAQLPSSTTSMPPVPVANHVQQPSPSEPSLFDPERANECAEALKNRFPQINQESEVNVPDAIVHASAQQSTMSVPDPLANHSPSLYDTSLFDPERTDQALKNGFPQIHPEGESSLSDAIMDATVQPSTMSVLVPVVNHSEQRPSLYVSSLFNPANVDEWSPFSDFLQN